MNLATAIFRFLVQYEAEVTGAVVKPAIESTVRPAGIMAITPVMAPVSIPGINPR